MSDTNTPASAPPAPAAPAAPTPPPAPAEQSFYGGKFKSVTDLEKSYGELEKRLGSQPAAPAPVPDDLQFGQVLKNSGFSDEDFADGTVKPEQWSKLKDKLPGVSLAMANEFLGTTAAARKLAQQVAIGIAGGEQELATLIEFSNGLPEAEKAKVLAGLNGFGTFQETLAGLKTMYEQNNGARPSHVEASAPAAAAGGFRTTAEFHAARKEAQSKYGDWRQSAEFMARLDKTPGHITTAI